ncbi:helix-turn-helix domain-containing protein [Peribacillus frigoritolerans]|nr:helix-turn-helix domain-containing protein [Peribacillus frigoritolerans]
MEWYTQKEVADLLGVSKATVYHYGKQKKIIEILDYIKRPVMKKRKWTD